MILPRPSRPTASPFVLLLLLALLIFSPWTNATSGTAAADPEGTDSADAATATARTKATLAVVDIASDGSLREEVPGDGRQSFETEATTTSSSSSSLPPSEWDSNAAAAAAVDGSGRDCHVLQLMAFDDEIKRGERILSEGLRSFHYPVYERGSDDDDDDDDDEDGSDDDDERTSSSSSLNVVGEYIGASTAIGGGDDNDCLGMGSFLLDYNDDTDSYDSQIFVAVSCSGADNAVVGGTGRFEYMQNGYERITVTATVTEEEEEEEAAAAAAADDAQTGHDGGRENEEPPRLMATSELHLCF